jgi:hypothetical protein
MSTKRGPRRIVHVEAAEVDEAALAAEDAAATAATPAVGAGAKLTVESD